MANIIRALQAPTRRIDGGIFEARLGAERIVAEAREAARDIGAAAEADAARLRQAAVEEGRSEAAASASELLAWAASERDRLLATAEAEVVRLALGLAAKILAREAEHGGAVAHDMARRALAEARGRTVLALRVHPLDLAGVREREPELPANASGMAWISDPAVGRGGAVVETETGFIDARLETQLEVVRRAIASVAP